jgi:hypothetical protein
LLVNVDNNTLRRLMDIMAAMDALMSIESFRSLNADIETFHEGTPLGVMLMLG